MTRVVVLHVSHKFTRTRVVSLHVSCEFTRTRVVALQVSCEFTCTYPLVSRGQTAFLAQGVITCSISARTKKGSGLSGRVVLDTSVLRGGVDYIDVTFKRQAWSTFRRSYGVPVFFVSFTSELFVEPEEVKEITWK